MTDPADASSHPPPDASEIDIESGVGALLGLGFLKLRWGEKEGQITTREARIHALRILEAAAAADHDAAVYQWLTGRMEMDIPGAAAVLADLRTARAKVDEESGNT